MKIVFLFVFISLANLCATAQPAVDSNFHIYLLIGQSNMAGRAPIDNESKKINPHIFMLDKNDNWVPATDPVHFDKPGVAGVGPAINFAKEMLGNNKNIKIGLVPCAWGGSPIRVWEPDSIYFNNAHPYDGAVSRAKIAMLKGVLKGILWHQGESDNNPRSAAVYMEKLKTMIHRFRTDLQLPEVPFVAGEIGYFGKGILINKVIDELPLNVPNTAVVSAAGLTDKGDKTHFDTKSARELGKRYALAIVALQSKAK